MLLDRSFLQHQKLILDKFGWISLERKSPFHMFPLRNSGIPLKNITLAKSKIHVLYWTCMIQLSLYSIRFNKQQHSNSCYRLYPSSLAWFKSLVLGSGMHLREASRGDAHKGEAKDRVHSPTTAWYLLYTPKPNLLSSTHYLYGILPE